MKAAIMKVAESAKYRDSINRNLVPIVNTHSNIGTILWDQQLTISQLAGSKLTQVILVDSDGKSYLLQFNCGLIGAGVDSITSTRVKFEEDANSKLDATVDVKGGE